MKRLLDPVFEPEKNCFHIRGVKAVNSGPIVDQ